MIIIVSAIAFVLLLTLLILIHELGHFVFARIFGVDVEEFGFGLPPKIRTLFWRGRTEFTLNWVPFGGFVKLKGENEANLEKRLERGSFAAAGTVQRLLILFGGVAMNFILAYALLVFGFSVGQWVPNFYSTVEKMQEAAARGEITLEFGVYVTEVLPGSPAEQAGLTKDSAIQAVDGQPVETPDEVIALQEGKDTVTYTLLEGTERITRQVVMELEDGKAGVQISSYARKLAAPRRSLPKAIVLATRETAFMCAQTIVGIAKLFRSLLTRAQVPEGITGIVGIAVLTHSSVQEGFMTYLRLVALLSLSLAILNVLPLPALDGGRIAFVVLETIIRRPLNRKFELTTNAVGFLLLIVLIVVITFNDVIHLFRAVH